MYVVTVDCEQGQERWDYESFAEANRDFQSEVNWHAKRQHEIVKSEVFSCELMHSTMGRTVIQLRRVKRER